MTPLCPLNFSLAEVVSRALPYCTWGATYLQPGLLDKTGNRARRGLVLQPNTSTGLVSSYAPEARGLNDVSTIASEHVGRERL